MTNYTFIKIPNFTERLWNISGGAKGNYNGTNITGFEILVSRAQFIQNFTVDFYYCTNAAF